MKIESEYKPKTNQTDSQFLAFHLLSQSTKSQICNEEKKKKKTPILIPKSYFIYFKTLFYNLSNILFIIFHITLNTIHFLFISLSFLSSLSLHSNVSFFTHISNPIAKKKKKKKKQQSPHPPRIYHHHHNKSKVFPILITKGKENLANLKEESHPGLQEKDAI